MGKKYHISPVTGPGLCRAAKGNCPYGGNSGVENHYDTYSEAVVASQRMLKKAHQLLPSVDNIRTAEKEMLKKEEKRKEKEMSEKIPKNEVEFKDFLCTTDDEELILNILQGKVLEVEGWTNIGLVLQNPNLSIEIIDDVIYENPDNYNIEMQRRIMSNPALTQNDLMYVANHHEDMITRTLAFRNSSLGKDPLGKEYAEYLMKNESEKLTQLPWAGLLHNEGFSGNLFREWKVNNDSSLDEYEHELMYIIGRNYGEWMEGQERRDVLGIVKDEDAEFLKQFAEEFPDWVF